MIRSVYIGSGPTDEEVVQVGSLDYEDLATAECERFVQLIRATSGPEEGTAHLDIIANPHAFGSYMAVECTWEDGDPVGQAYALKVDKEIPTKWR